MEYITEILIGEYCVTIEKGVHSLNPTTNVVEEQSVEIRNTLDVVDVSSFSDTSTKGCPPLYVGDMEISLE